MMREEAIQVLWECRAAGYLVHACQSVHRSDRWFVYCWTEEVGYMYHVKLTVRDWRSQLLLEALK